MQAALLGDKFVQTGLNRRNQPRSSSAEISYHLADFNCLRAINSRRGLVRSQFASPELAIIKRPGCGLRRVIPLKQIWRGLQLCRPGRIEYPGHAILDRSLRCE
jgi:hypothetical protein